MKRGFFRLWVILTVVWIAGGTWLLWNDLTGQQIPIFGPPMMELRIQALELILLPPIGLLILGCAGFWVGRGFKS